MLKIQMARCRNCAVNFTSGNLCQICESVKRHQFPGQTAINRRWRTPFRILTGAVVIALAFGLLLPKLIELTK